MKFKVWQKVSNLFRDCTGKDLDHIKCRKLFGRLKSEEKQKHDNLVIKQFTVECGKTGGGAGPEAPPEMDGDNVPTDTEKVEYLDPTPTPWNSLAVMGVGQKVVVKSSTNRGLQQSLGQNVPDEPSTSGGFQPSFRVPLHQGIVRPKFRPGCKTLTPEGQPAGLISPSLSDSSPSPQITPKRSEKVQIVQQNEDGSTETIMVEVEDEKNMPKKVRVKEEVLDPANKYWTEMLLMQRKNMGLQSENMRMQKTLLQEKIKVELLRQKFFASKVEATVDKVEESEVSEEDEEEEDLFLFKDK